MSDDSQNTKPPILRHPARDDSWKPKQRKTMLGVEVPSLRPPKPPEISLKSDGHAETNDHRTLKLVSGIIGAIGTIVLGFWQGLPAILSATKSTESPATTAPMEPCATQAAHDQLAAKVHRLQETLQQQGESACSLNGGAFGPNWPECPSNVYYTPADGLRLKRTDRVYKDPQK